MSKISEVYKERNALILALAAFAEYNGFHVWSVPAPDDPEYTIIYIELDEGQVSWHIPNEELGNFSSNAGSTVDEFKWDGHGTVEKYNRLKSFADSVFSIDLG